jgi:hypothetical protein
LARPAWAQEPVDTRTAGVPSSVVRDRHQDTEVLHGTTQLRPLPWPVATAPSVHCRGLSPQPRPSTAVACRHSPVRPLPWPVATAPSLPHTDRNMGEAATGRQPLVTRRTAGMAHAGGRASRARVTPEEAPWPKTRGTCASKAWGRKRPMGYGVARGIPPWCTPWCPGQRGSHAGAARGMRAARDAPAPPPRARPRCASPAPPPPAPPCAPRPPSARRARPRRPGRARGRGRGGGRRRRRPRGGGGRGGRRAGQPPRGGTWREGGGRGRAEEGRVRPASRGVLGPWPPCGGTCPCCEWGEIRGELPLQQALLCSPPCPPQGDAGPPSRSPCPPKPHRPMRRRPHRRTPTCAGPAVSFPPFS